MKSSRTSLLLAIGFVGVVSTTNAFPQSLPVGIKQSRVVGTSLFIASAEPTVTRTIVNNLSNDDNNNEESFEFPPPLSAVDRLKRAATFWSTALPIVASYYGLISSIKMREILGQAPSAKDLEDMWAAQHTDGASKLAQTVTDLKGFYIKTAQIISSRRDLFPQQYTDALADFTDNVDPMPASLAKAVVTSELLHADEKFEDVFAEFDQEPLGAASVAQVHRAVLTEKYGGREVAVKVREFRFFRCNPVVCVARVSSRYTVSHQIQNECNS